MGTNTNNLNLYRPAQGETGYAVEVNENWNILDRNVPHELATGTVTGSGGAGEPGPAFDGTITNVTTDETAVFDVVVGVDSDPGSIGDYAYNYNVSRFWDNTLGQINVDLTINWDTDPGAGNDVTFRYTIQERDI